MYIQCHEEQTKSEENGVKKIHHTMYTVKNGGGDNHTKNWCERIATGLTPDFSVMVTPSIMV